MPLKLRPGARIFPGHGFAGTLFVVAPVTRPTATVTTPLAQQPRGAIAGNPVQSNSRVCGGARHGGRLVALVAAAFESRWRRIFSITAGSSMQAMIRAAPWKRVRLTRGFGTKTASRAMTSKGKGARHQTGHQQVYNLVQCH